MARKRKSGLEPWMETCFRCQNMLRLHYLDDGVDNGAVRFQCKVNDEDVKPWYIDGCKKFEAGKPEDKKEDRKI